MEKCCQEQAAGLGNSASSNHRAHRKVTEGNPDFLSVPRCPLWLRFF